MMRSVPLIRCGAVAAIVGGLMWIAKAGAILLTGDEPPLMFAGGTFVFPFALLGLHASLKGRGGRPAMVGLVLVSLAAVSVVVTATAALVAPDGWRPQGEDDVTPLTPFIVVGGFGAFIGLVFLGVATLRAQTLPSGWNGFPLAFGVAVLPLMLVGGLLITVSERLLELPILLLGLGWVILGFCLWSTERGRQDRAARSTVRIPVGP